MRRYAAPFWAWYLGGMLFLALTNWLAVRIPVHMAVGIDALESDLSLVRDQVWIIAAMGLGMILVRTASRVLFFTPGRLVEFRLKNDIFRQLTRLQPRFFSTHEGGDIVSRAANDVTYLRAMVGFGGLQICNVVLALLFTGGEMFRLSPRLTGIVVIPVVVGLLVVQIAIFKMHALVRTSQRQLGELSDNVLSSLQGMQTIQGFTAEESFVARFSARSAAFRDTNISLAWIQATAMPLLLLAGSISIYLLLAAGGPMAVRGEVSVGELVAFVAFISYLLWPLFSLGWLVSVVQRGLNSLERIDEVLYAQPERPEGERGVELPAGAPDIALRELSFRYPGAEEDSLSELSLEIPAGTMLGIYGRTGSGKTTLLRVLQRSWNPPVGAVRVGDHDLLELDLSAWRSKLAIAPQVAFLFSSSIRENIAMGLELDKVPQSAERAALGPDLEALPSGLDTVVGERGIMLSGGQRQRTALARALHRDADILLLDDVLSAVDQKTERELIDTLDQLASSGREGRGRPTTVLVSHRMSVLARTDRVVVLAEGRVIDQGTHAELIERPGPYREAWLGEQEGAA